MEPTDEVEERLAVADRRRRMTHPELDAAVAVAAVRLVGAGARGSSQ